VRARGYDPTPAWDRSARLWVCTWEGRAGRRPRALRGLELPWGSAKGQDVWLSSGNAPPVAVGQNAFNLTGGTRGTEEIALDLIAAFLA
jgi:hypothetical protein